MSIGEAAAQSSATSAPRRRKVAETELRGGRRSAGRPAPDIEVHLGTPPMWRRLAARTIDLINVGVWMFAFAIAHIFLHMQLWSDSIAPSPWGTWFLTTMTFFVLYAIYEIVFIAKLGATPGKDLMGIRVVDDATGERPSLGQAARRWFLPGIVQPIPGAWIGGILTLTWGATGLIDPERRTVHDRLAGTRIVAKEPPATEADREKRRRDFTPRLIDPFAVFRAARSNPSKYRQHPNHNEP